MTRLPAHARGLFELLRGGGSNVPERLDDGGWRRLLKFADETQCTLFLRRAPGLPDWFVHEIDARWSRNGERRKRLRDAYQEASAALRSRGIEFVLLKSFTHEQGFGIEGAQRVQYDLDFLLTAPDLPAANAALRGIGYAPHGTTDLSELHTRPLIKPSDWRWRGDYYDPGMPIPIELHTKLWNSKSDRVLAPGVEAFWSRRVISNAIPALAEPDRVGFAALHVLRHILHNNVRMSHVFELARFLESRAEDALFWESWRNLHDPGLRRLETIAFRFAVEWFGCGFPAAVEETWQSMGAKGRSWFDRFAFSPVVNLTEPNKDVIWLHAALLPNVRDRWTVLAKRLLPLRVPARAPFSRAAYHARALAPALWNGVRWRWAASSTASETSDWKRPRV